MRVDCAVDQTPVPSITREILSLAEMGSCSRAVKAFRPLLEWSIFIMGENARGPIARQTPAKSELDA